MCAFYTEERVRRGDRKCGLSHCAPLSGTDVGGIPTPRRAGHRLSTAVHPNKSYRLLCAYRISRDCRNFANVSITLVIVVHCNYYCYYYIFDRYRQCSRLPSLTRCNRCGRTCVRACVPVSPTTVAAECLPPNALRGRLRRRQTARRTGGR